MSEIARNLLAPRAGLEPMYFRLTRDEFGADSKGLTIVIRGNTVSPLEDALAPAVWVIPFLLTGPRVRVLREDRLGLESSGSVNSRATDSHSAACRRPRHSGP